MIRYRVDADVPAVVAVECEPGGYPKRDVDGRIQYENTHYDRENQAWLKLLVECEARVELAGARREECVAALGKATDALAHAAQLLVKARDLAPKRVRDAARTCGDCGALVGECECN